jgi:hypothetical protein
MLTQESFMSDFFGFLGGIPQADDIRTLDENELALVSLVQKSAHLPPVRFPFRGDGAVGL